MAGSVIALIAFYGIIGIYIAVMIAASVARARSGQRAVKAADAAWEATRHERCLKDCARLEATLALPLIIEGERILPEFAWTPVLAAMSDEEFDQHVARQIGAPEPEPPVVVERVRAAQSTYVGRWTGGSL